jgi:hypothetical protein
MKVILAGAVALAIAIGIAVPASGASPASLAAKALKVANKANKAASRASKSASKANTTANNAAAAAGTALTAAQQGPASVEVDSGNVYAAPNNFARFDVKCPSGFVPSGFGPGLGALELVAALPTGSGYLASYFNPSNSTSYSGNLIVVCVRGSFQATAKRLSRRAAVDELSQRESDRLDLRRPR